jgi:hypothetical protein
MSTPVQPPQYAPEPPVPSPPTPAGDRPPPSSGVVAWRVVGGLVAAVIVVLSTAGVVSAFTEQRRTTTTTFPQALSKVVVDTGTGSVDLKGGRAGSQVVVERRTRSSLGTAPTSSEAVAGSVLTLRGGCRGLGLCDVAYTVTVPPGTAVTVTTDTGSVDASGLDGDLDVTTSTGSIELDGLRSARVAAQASTGSVELGFAAPPQDVRAETSTGSVEVVVPGDGTAYAVQSSTSVGSSEVTVPVDSSSPRRIQARASTGSVEVRPGS